MSARRKTGGTRRQVAVRRARLSGIVLALAVAVAAGDWTIGQLQRPDLMPLNRVVVDGELEHLRRDQLEAVVTLAVWGNFLTVDIEAVREAAQSLPWVAAASVRRRWPDTLVIRVREREPFARWGDGELVNRSGEVFRPASMEGIEDLPLLEGPNEEQGAEVVQRYVELSRAIAPSGASLTRLRLDRRGGWQLWLDGGVEVALGGESMHRRLDRVLLLMRLLGKGLEDVARIDARYASGIAVRRKDVGAAGGSVAEPVEG